MKIAHLPFGYYPDAVGGTEVYVHALALEQRRRGAQPCVIAPGGTNETYAHDGVNVYRFAVDDSADVGEVYARDASVDHEAFERMLDQRRPDVLHVHGYTPAVTARMIAAAKARSCRIVFTYHTPTATCVRGTLLRWGDVVCDGALTRHRCAACSLQLHGVPRAAAWAVTTVGLRRAPANKLGTMLRMRALVQARHEQIELFLASCDSVVATAEWVSQLLLRVGVPPTRITLSRQGVYDRIAPALHRTTGVVKLAFLGRMDVTKGLAVAQKAVSGLPIELDVYPTGRLTQRDVLPTLQRYDALVVPSQWLETGPLVVLEAFEAGIPVIGSNLGGIAELVRDGVDGLLVPYNDEAAWRTTMRRIADDRSVLTHLRANVMKPRGMDDVANDMERVYRS